MYLNDMRVDTTRVMREQPISNTTYINNFFLSENAQAQLLNILKLYQTAQYYQPNTPINQLHNCPIEQVKPENRMSREEFKEYIKKNY